MQRHLLKTIVLSTMVLISCSDKETQKNAVEIEVPVVDVQLRDIPIYREFVGQTYGESDIEIRSRVDGWVTSMPFTEGGSVKKGQLLYTIDALPYQSKVDKARGELAAAQANFANADANLKRIKPLAAINAVSQRELDAAQANYDATRSIVDAQKANLANQNIELSYTRVLSPINGVIGISEVRVGDYVSSLSSSGLLNTVSAINSLRVRFPVGEQDLLKISRERAKEKRSEVNHIPAELVLADGSVFEHKGQVNFADRQVDPETGTLTVEADFPNPDGFLRPGQFVRVRLIFEQRNDAIIIPQRAVVETQGIFKVFTISPENKIVPKIVYAGLQVGNEWIIDSGLVKNDRVAILGNVFIQPDAIVKPVKADWKPSNKSAESN